MLYVCLSKKHMRSISCYFFRNFHQKSSIFIEGFQRIRHRTGLCNIRATSERMFLELFPTAFDCVGRYTNCTNYETSHWNICWFTIFIRLHRFETELLIMNSGSNPGAIHFLRPAWPVSMESCCESLILNSWWVQVNRLRTQKGTIRNAQTFVILTYPVVWVR